MNGEIYYRENSRMARPELNDTAKGRVRGMVELRDSVHQLIDLQMDQFTPDAAIREKQAELTALYDAFTTKYGLINSRGNSLAFSGLPYTIFCVPWKFWTTTANLERKSRHVYQTHHP